MRALTAFAMVLFARALSSAQDADLILTDGRLWTGDSTRPFAEAVAIRDGRFLVVGSATDAERHRAAHTRVIALGGRFSTPGFIDNHTHFNQAGALLLGVNLLEGADARGACTPARARSEATAAVSRSSARITTRTPRGAYSVCRVPRDASAKRDAEQPELDLVVVPANMNVWRFDAVTRVEIEPIRTNAQHRGHGESWRTAPRWATGPVPDPRHPPGTGDVGALADPRSGIARASDARWLPNAQASWYEARLDLHGDVMASEAHTTDALTAP